MISEKIILQPIFSPHGNLKNHWHSNCTALQVELALEILVHEFWTSEDPSLQNDSSITPVSNCFFSKNESMTSCKVRKRISIDVMHSPCLCLQQERIFARKSKLRGQTLCALILQILSHRKDLPVVFRWILRECFSAPRYGISRDYFDVIFSMTLSRQILVAHKKVLPALTSFDNNLNYTIWFY